MPRTLLAIVACAAVAAASAATAATAAAPSRPAFPGIAAKDLDLIRGYTAWTRLTKPPPASQAGLGSAHPGRKAVYASPPRSALVRGGRQRFPYPVGTRILKTATTGGAVTLVAIMRKVAATGRAGAGWDYIEYTRASAGERFAKVAFPASGCAGCHAGARATDRVFFSLRP